METPDNGHRSEQGIRERGCQDEFIAERRLRQTCGAAVAKTPAEICPLVADLGAQETERQPISTERLREIL